MSAIATTLRPRAQTTASPDRADDPAATSRADSHRSLWSACGVSLLLHACLLGALALVWTMIPDRGAGVRAISAVMSDSDTDAARQKTPFDEVAALTRVAPATAVRSESAGRFQSPLKSPAESLMPTGSNLHLSSSVISSPWQTADVTGNVFLRGSSAGSGDGTEVGAGELDNSGHAFFGLKPVGRRYAFVLDCSRSMNHPHDTPEKTRFNRMRSELTRSIGAMGPESEFHIIFFNDFAISMPSSVPVQAAERPKMRFLYWVQGLQPAGNTEPLAAILQALSLQPDVLFFLTDGSFTHRVEQDLLNIQKSGTEIHTYAFEEPFTDEMRRAYHQLLDDDRTGARRTVGSRNDFRKLVEIFESHQFMKTMAKRHGGRFRLIPYDG